MNYIKNTKEDWVNNKNKFEELVKGKEIPYKIEFTFIRNSRRKFDYINPCQTVQDLMVKYDYQVTYAMNVEIGLKILKKNMNMMPVLKLQIY